MIDISTLSPADVGRWVAYSVVANHIERGRIKSWSEPFIYVVFRCSDKWDDFQRYPAAPTLPQNLSFEEAAANAENLESGA